MRDDRKKKTHRVKSRRAVLLTAVFMFAVLVLAGGPGPARQPQTRRTMFAVMAESDMKQRKIAAETEEGVCLETEEETAAFLPAWPATGNGTEVISAAAAGEETGAGTAVSVEKVPEPPAEAGTEIKARPESGAELETEGMETEAETETEVETEAGTETEVKTETEAGTETEVETETEAGTEAEVEIETEAGAETEVETETETGAETEDETETETGTENETEALLQVIHISQIRLKKESAVREYDGTDNAALSYLASWEEWPVKGGIPCQSAIQQPYRDLPPGVSVTLEAHTAGSDAGEWQVLYSFALAGENAKDYSLVVDDAALVAVITPRKLRITIPAGSKRYGEKAVMKQIHLSGEVMVSGFLKDRHGKEIIPDDFKMPVLSVDTEIVSRWSEMYTPDGKQKIYRGALTVRKTEEGKNAEGKAGQESLTGNPGTNYCFAQEMISGGDLVIRPGRVTYGKDYTIYTDYGVPVYAGNDVITGPRGGLGIEPAGGKGYNKGSFVFAQGSGGEARLYLSLCDAQDNILAQSEAVAVTYVTDAGPPAIQIDISGGEYAGDGSYYAGAAKLQIDISDAGGSGVAAGRCFVTGHSGQTQTISCRDGCTFSLTKEGSYTIFAEASDYAGNIHRTAKQTVIIDTSPPVITVSGVEDQSANRGKLSISAEASDRNFHSGSLTAVLSGPAQGQVLQPSVRYIRDGERMRFPAIPALQEMDGVYTLTVSASDLAGNEAHKSIRFSVNRFGSSYTLAQETGNMLKTYYHTGPFPIVFIETNVDAVGEAAIMISHNGVVRFLDNAGFTTDREKNGDGNKYTYTIPASACRKEGVYEVMLMTGDAAGNRSDTLSKGLRAGFVIDRTAPDCLVTGIEAMGVYEGESRVVIIEPRDNLQLDRVSVTLDDKVIREAGSEEIEAAGGLLRLTLQAANRWQTLSVTAWDAAGNKSSSGDIPVLLTRKPMGDIPIYTQDHSGEKDEKSMPGRETEMIDEQYAAETEITASEPVSVRAESPGHAAKRKQERIKEDIEKDTEERKIKGTAQRIGWNKAASLLICVLLLAESVLHLRKRRQK